MRAMQEMSPINQPDYVDGELIHVGGEDETVSVHLREEGTLHRCTTSVQMARRLESYLYGPPIRAFGTANWVRHEVTGWELQRFFIEEFVPLEDKTLARALSELEELEL